MVSISGEPFKALAPITPPAAGNPDFSTVSILGAPALSGEPPPQLNHLNTQRHLRRIGQRLHGHGGEQRFAPCSHQSIIVNKPSPFALLRVTANVIHSAPAIEEVETRLYLRQRHPAIRLRRAAVLQENVVNPSGRVVRREQRPRSLNGPPAFRRKIDQYTVGGHVVDRKLVHRHGSPGRAVQADLAAGGEPKRERKLRSRDIPA